MEMLSEEYGWTPSQIRNESRLDIEIYLKIIRMKRLIANKESKKYGRK
jgi:hypothetical protein